MRRVSNGNKLSPTTVMETLEQEDDVGEGIVCGKDYHGWKNALETGANDVEKVAEEPDGYEWD